MQVSAGCYLLPCKIISILNAEEKVPTDPIFERQANNIKNQQQSLRQFDNYRWIHLYIYLWQSLKPNEQTGLVRTTCQNKNLRWQRNWTGHCWCTYHILFHLKTRAPGWQPLTDAAEFFLTLVCHISTPPTPASNLFSTKEHEEMLILVKLCKYLEDRGLSLDAIIKTRCFVLFLTWL